MRRAPEQRRVEARFFKFGKNGFGAEDAGIVGSQGRDDYSYDDVEQYFNYMGFLAEEGSYDRMDAMLNKPLHPIDVILILACHENDTPKVGTGARSIRAQTSTQSRERWAGCARHLSRQTLPPLGSGQSAALDYVLILESVLAVPGASRDVCFALDPRRWARF